MKKIILTLALIVLGASAFADCADVVCVEPYDLSHSASRFISSITGQKLLNEKIGGLILKKIIKKNIIGGKIKIDIKSFSGRDLRAGRFKSAKFSGKNMNIQGVHISNFEAETLCNFNYITENKNKELIIKEDMPIKFKILMSEDDINNTMISTDYKRVIDNINSIGGNFNLINIETANVKIKNNKIYYIFKYSLPFVRVAKEIVLCSDLEVVNGQIRLKNASLLGNNLSMDVDKLSRILNYINPLDFSSKVLNNKDAKCKIENIYITDNKVTVEGKLIILKDKE